MPCDVSNEEECLREAVDALLAQRSSTVGVGGGRRLSQSSVEFFQTETSTRNLSITSVASSTGTDAYSTRSLVACLDGCDHGLIGSDGKVRDEYIMRRQGASRPATLAEVPLLCDLAESASIFTVDGRALTMLLVSGFARISSRVDELNAINVFPIADGDTGANMKVCLKLPTRNLLLNPSDNILTVASNVAADILLNGQGNSGTILSHFFVSLAKEIRELKKASLTMDEFAYCLARAGAKMDDAVANPFEGTLVSVCRDACRGLEDRGPYPSLKALLDTWNEIAQRELAMTPERLVVDGAKILKKAGVVDSGAQGFVYLVEGMHIASRGLLPSAMDAAMFASAKFMPADENAHSMCADHMVTDSRFRFCTECVVQLKEDVDAQAVIDGIQKAADDDNIGDSIASVKAPGEDGGDNMVKIHIHTNEPDLFFDRLRPYSREPILKKEKVEDMLVMRELMHGDGATDLGDAKFTIMGLSSLVLPPLDDMDELYTFPLFLVPETTQEPIDCRFVSSTDTCVALNQQRHKETAIRYTTAAPNPMQIKIEILAALGTGKPLLVFLMSMNKRVSAIGRNTMAAIDMLEPEQKALVRVMVHGWGGFEAPFLLEAIKCAREGKTIDEAYEACKRVADLNFSFSNFVTSATVQKLRAWRPGIFPEGFSVEDNSFVGFGIPTTVREEAPTEFERLGQLMNLQNQAKTMTDLQDAEIARIKKDLKPHERIRAILVQTVGRPDYGYHYLEKMKDANVPMTNDVATAVYSSSFASVAMGAWGEMSAQYVVEMAEARMQ